ncbi:MAG: hypothetical protein V3S12_00020 [Acidiferrobacterales bacterium]
MADSAVVVCVVRWSALFVLLIVGCSGGGSKPGIEPLLPPEPPPPALLCTHTLTWVNPTEDTGGNTLAPDALVAATLYATLIPMEPVQYDWIVDVPPYVLLWAITDIERSGTWHYDLTVSNEAGESLPGSTTKECTR